MGGTPRGRQVALLELSVDDYKDAISTWMSSAPQVELMLRLGPKLATDVRSISAEGFLAVKPLIELFMAAGARNCVVQLKKLEDALRKVLSSNKHWLGDSHIDVTVDKAKKNTSRQF